MRAREGPEQARTTPPPLFLFSPALPGFLLFRLTHSLSSIYGAPTVCLALTLTLTQPLSKANKNCSPCGLYFLVEGDRK